jgi:NAD(P)-dependent dehydrogenase (short-subunit alcohol dehydrogenase family)
MRRLVHYFFVTKNRLVYSNQISTALAGEFRTYTKQKEAEMKLAGKVALITGGNSGIGLATAKQFVKEGAYIFITGRRETELAAAAKEIRGNVTAIPGDVSNLDDLDRLFAGIKREKGKLDIVFANAGIGPRTPLGTITEEDYNSIFNANVKGLLFTVQKALPLMLDGASIILNASVVASKGFADWSVYSATKAAVRSFARTWTADLKARRIRVNVVSPGYIDTPPWRSIEAAEHSLRPFPRLFPSAGLAQPRRLRRRWCFSRQTTAATSRERNCLWTVVSPRFRPSFAVRRKTKGLRRGVKHSGYGRELSDLGIKEFVVRNLSS